MRWMTQGGIRGQHGWVSTYCLEPRARSRVKIETSEDETKTGTQFPESQAIPLQVRVKTYLTHPWSSGTIEPVGW